MDDEPNLLRSLARALRILRPSWNVHVAQSGAEALRHLRGRSYDAVVTDIEMPGIDGLSLLAKVQSQHPRVVRLVHSARVEDTVPHELRRVAQGALPKPAHPKHLVSLIESTLAALA